MDSHQLTNHAENDSGVFHWCLQRISAVLLIPLTFWLVVFLNLSLTADYQETLNWLDNKLNLFCLLSWFIIACYHAALGLQVVFEDYISTATLQRIAIWTSNTLFLLITIAALFFSWQLM